MSRRKRRIAVITGTRAEFGLLAPVLRALAARAGLEPRLIATGMHLLPKFGRTVEHIRAAGWRVDAAVPMQTGRDEARSEPLALARGIGGIARSLDRLDCEIVVVLGDRIEAFAGACAAVTGRRALAHIHGGDRATGDVDDVLRNAITRLAHVHFAASEDAAGRLRRMGEEAFRIHRVGAPGLDDIRQFRRLSRGAMSGWASREGIPAGRSVRRDSCTSKGGEGVRRDFRTGDRVSEKAKAGKMPAPPGLPYALIVQHPIGRSGRRESVTMGHILAAVEAAGLAGVIIYPNSDPGHEGIIRVIERHDGRPGWQVFRSLPRGHYLWIASQAAVMVGNSSSGIIESASLGVNAVNVGPRQAGRLHCGPGVSDCSESPGAIRRAIAQALARPRPRPGRSVYGDGRAGERIAAILERLIISPRLLQKALTY